MNMTEIQSSKTAVLYAREPENIDLPSMDRQVESMIDWCASNDAGVARIFVDDEPINSVGYDEAMGFVAMNSPDVLLMWSAGAVVRERDYMDLQGFCKEHGCVIRYVSSGVEPEGEVGELLAYMDFLNTQNAIRLAKRVVQ